MALHMNERLPETPETDLAFTDLPNVDGMGSSGRGAMAVLLYLAVETRDSASYSTVLAGFRPTGCSSVQSRAVPVKGQDSRHPYPLVS